MIDPLTGLPQQLEPSGTVVTLNLHHFKQFNDQYGYATGDRLLIEVARRLRSTTAGVARIGGDRFAVAVGCLPISVSP